MRLNFIQTAIMVACVDCTSRVLHVFDSLAIRESEGRLRSIKITVADPNELIVTRNGITCDPIRYTVAESNRRIVLDPQSAHKRFSNGDEFSSNGSKLVYSCATAKDQSESIDCC